MIYPIPQNQPEQSFCNVQRDRRIAFRLMNDLLRQIEKLPIEARSGGLNDAYDVLEKVYQCRAR